MNRTLFIALSAILFFTGWLDPYKDNVSKGNSEFHSKKYEEAKTSYNVAEKYAPGENDKKKLSFNKADADYMSEKYDNAVTNFQNSLQADDPEVQKKAFFNLGNSYMKMGKNREAADSYIKALQIDPNYMNAKKNLEYLLNKKKNDDKNKDGKDSKDKSGDKQDKSGKDQDKNKSGDDRKDKSDNRQQQQKGQSSMSRDQVKNILESMKNKPVKREKGSANDRRFLDKPW